MTAVKSISETRYGENFVHITNAVKSMKTRTEELVKHAWTHTWPL